MNRWYKKSWNTNYVIEYGSQVYHYNGKMYCTFEQYNSNKGKWVTKHFEFNSGTAKWSFLSSASDYPYSNAGVLPGPYGECAWLSHQGKLFYSYSDSQYIYNSSGNYWTKINWSGCDPDGEDVWTDGKNTYYSDGYYQYKLVSASAGWSSSSTGSGSWEYVSWGSLRPNYGRYVWTDGTEMYYSYSNQQYHLNKTTNQWEAITWGGITPSFGNDTWLWSGRVMYTSGDTWILHKHNWNDGEIVATSTCDANGVAKFKCKSCNEEAEVPLPTAEHTWQQGDTIEPTCTADGYTEYTCTGCGVTKHDNLVTALGHNYVKISTTDPTCVNAGYSLYECARCRETYEDDVTDATGIHNYQAWEVLTPSTCITHGQRQHECATCHYLEFEELELAAHDYDTWHTVTEPDCIHAGLKEHACKVCGATETASIAPDDSKHQYGAWKDVEISTCVTEGTRRKVCEICGDVVYEKTAVVNHTYENWVVTKQPTCVDEGVETGTCTCGAVGTRVIAPTADHKYDDWKILTESTCVTHGQKQQTCRYCHQVVTENLPLANHVLSEWEMSYPDCTHYGENNRHCLNDGCNYSENEIVDEPLGHDYQPNVIAPTCSQSGYTLHECTRCRASYRDTETAATGKHEYSDWYTILPPTTKASGMEQRMCEICHLTENREIAMLVADDDFPVVPVVAGSVAGAAALGGLAFIITAVVKRRH